MLFCAPEYAGGLPGTFKNLLDWTVGGPEMDGRPVASINVAADGRGENAQASLRLVLGYLSTEIVEAAWRRVFVPREAIDHGSISDRAVRTQLAETLDAFVAHVEGRGARRSP